MARFHHAPIAQYPFTLSHHLASFYNFAGLSHLYCLLGFFTSPPTPSPYDSFFFDFTSVCNLHHQNYSGACSSVLCPTFNIPSSRNLGPLAVYAPVAVVSTCLCYLPLYLTLCRYYHLFRQRSIEELQPWHYLKRTVVKKEREEKRQVPTYRKSGPIGSAASSRMRLGVVSPSLCLPSLRVYGTFKLR